jgi:hypothetical protein
MPSPAEFETSRGGTAGVLEDDRHFHRLAYLERYIQHRINRSKPCAIASDKRVFEGVIRSVQSVVLPISDPNENHSRDGENGARDIIEGLENERAFVGDEGADFPDARLPGLAAICIGRPLIMASFGASITRRSGRAAMCCFPCSLALYLGSSPFPAHDKETCSQC